MFQKSVNRDFNSKQFKNLSEDFTSWLDTLGYKSNTVKLSERNIKEFFAYLETQNTTHLKDFRNSQVTEYLEYLQHRPNQMKPGSLSPGYINKHITSLRLFSKYLQLSGKAGIIIKPGILKTEESATFLTKKEIELLYKSAKSEKNIYNLRDTAMLSIYYGCGLRASEGTALNISDILFEKDLLYVRHGKGYKERYVPISSRVKEDLQNYIYNQRNELLNGKQSEALLISRNCRRWSNQGIYNRLQLLKHNTNITGLQSKTFGLHILRHSIATHLLQSGMKLEYISRFLGHKSLETTQKYVHLVNELID